MKPLPTWDQTKQFLIDWFDPNSKEFPQEDLPPGCYIKLITEASTLYGSAFAHFCSHILHERGNGHFCLGGNSWGDVFSEWEKVFSRRDIALNA